MRKSVLTGLFVMVLVATFGSQSSQAKALDILPNNDTNIAEITNLAIGDNLGLKVQTQATAEVPATPAPIVHTVAPNENLSTIAEQYQTTWVRLFNKNEQIADPNVVAVNDQIKIPAVDEQLADRPLPQPAAATESQSQESKKVTTKPSAASSKPAYSRGSSAGNTYTPGYCTWYAKNRRPDLPNNLGNASTWVSRAAVQGLATGSAPSVGAIGQQGNHVVYVESVNGDGTVTVSEMNHIGLYQISSRTVPASTFLYIY